MWRASKISVEQMKMKSFGSLLIVLALAASLSAQRAANNTDEKLKARNAPDVFLYSASAYGSDGKRSSNFTIEVGNNGAKTITAIEWEYGSSERIAGHGDRVKFRSDELKIRPEERKKLIREIGHYTVGFVTSFNLDSIRIMRVEYDDGSSWQRAADDK
jgi:hypothetical protein